MIIEKEDRKTPEETTSFVAPKTDAESIQPKDKNVSLELEQKLLAKLQTLTTEEIKSLADIANTEPSADGLGQLLHQEFQAVKEFLDHHSQAIDEAEKAYQSFTEKFGVAKENRPPTLFVGKAGYLVNEFKENPWFYYSKGRPDMASGCLSVHTNRVYFFVTPHSPTDDLAIQRVYLHENGHGAGKSLPPKTDNPLPRRGFAGNNLEEGLVESVARGLIKQINPDIFDEKIKKASNRFYDRDVQLFRNIAQQVPEELVFQAYFQGKYDELKKALADRMESQQINQLVPYSNEN